MKEEPIETPLTQRSAQMSAQKLWEYKSYWWFLTEILLQIVSNLKNKVMKETKPPAVTKGHDAELLFFMLHINSNREHS